MTTYNTDFKTIGQRILEARKAKGWTRPQLASKMTFCEMSIYRWEMDGVKPSIRAIRELEKALGTKLTK